MLAALGLSAVLATTSYRVAMPDPASHFFTVEVRFEQVKAPLRFAVPAFSPGGWKIASCHLTVRWRTGDESIFAFARRPA